MKKLVSLLMVLVMALMAMNVTTFAVDKEVLKERAKEAVYLDVSQYEPPTARSPLTNRRRRRC